MKINNNNIHSSLPISNNEEDDLIDIKISHDFIKQFITEVAKAFQNTARGVSSDSTLLSSSTAVEQSTSEKGEILELSDRASEL